MFGPRRSVVRFSDMHDAMFGLGSHFRARICLSSPSIDGPLADKLAERQHTDSQDLGPDELNAGVLVYIAPDCPAYSSYLVRKALLLAAAHRCVPVHLDP